MGGSSSIGPDGSGVGFFQMIGNIIEVVIVIACIIYFVSSLFRETDPKQEEIKTTNKATVEVVSN